MVSLRIIHYSFRLLMAFSVFRRLSSFPSCRPPILRHQRDHHFVAPTTRQQRRLQPTSSSTSGTTVLRFSSCPRNNIHSYEYRQELLNCKLQDLGIDQEALQQAAQRTLTDPLAGYDGTFGRSAIRAYRSFVYSKKVENDNNDNHAQFLLTGKAVRTAQQIEFLIKRHKSHQEAWVRHHDATPQSQSQSTQQDTTRPRIFPIIVVLDNLRSAFNVGSIFRTAEATGCTMVVTTGITPHPTGNGAEKVAKSALGADRSVPHSHFPTTAAALHYLRNSSQYANYTMVGLETTEQSQCYTDYTFPSTTGVVIVLGNEVTGVDTKIMTTLDVLLEIPMFGNKNSLNVASCAPIVLYEIVRQWT